MMVESTQPPLAAVDSNVEQTLEDKVRQNINELQALDRSYFGKDRAKQIRAKLDETTAMLDTKPIDLSKSPKIRET